MANNLTNTEENALLSLICGKTAYTLPTALYVGLFTAVSDQEAASVTEVSGGSYARVDTIGGGSKWGTASGGSIATSADIVFPTATADWGTVTHIGLNTASSSGTWKWIGALTASKIVNDGDVFKILAGELTLSLN